MGLRRSRVLCCKTIFLTSIKTQKSKPLLPYSNCKVYQLATPKPSAVTERDIERFVEDYLQKALPLKQKAFQIPQQEENVSCCVFGQQDFLIISQCNLHELSINILRRLPIYLVREFAVQVERDSFWYWAFTHDVVKHTQSSSLRNWQLMQSFETLMASHFAELSVPSYVIPRPALERLNRATSDIVSGPVKDLVSNKNNVLMYVCYPVLEGLAKFVLSPLVDCDGKPIADFYAGGKLFKKDGMQISSLATILRSLEENGTKILSKPEFSDNLRDFRLEVEKMLSSKLKKNQDGWESVYGLRNASLHGAIGWQLRSGLITNLICLILWNILDEQILSKELERFAVRWHVPFFESYYYPPEV